MKNPFVYGETVAGGNFCNRIQEINELVNDIKNGTNVIIFSPRRYGKTSLINQVLEIAGQKGIISFYIDLYPAINKQKFIEIYAQAISSGLPGKASRIVKKLKEYLPRIIPKVIMDDQSIHFEFGFDRSGSLSPPVDDLLEAGFRKSQTSMTRKLKERCGRFFSTIGMFPMFSWGAKRT